MKTKEKRLKNLGDNIKWSKMDVIEVLKEENENGTKKNSSKAARIKNDILMIHIAVTFSLETMWAGRQWNNIFKSSKFFKIYIK